MSSAPPAKPPKTPEQSRRELLTYAAMFFAAMVLAVPFVLIGFGVGYYCMSKIRKLEAILLIILAGVYMIVRFDVWGPAYYQWYLAILQQPSTSSVFRFPIFFALAAIAFTTGICVLLGPRGFLSFNIGKKIEISDSIIPTETERSVLASTGLTSQGLSRTPANSPETAQPVRRVNALAADAQSFAIGYSKVGDPVMLTEKDMETHCLLFGSTGSGKTETMKVIAAGLLDLGWSGVVIDLKEDTRDGGLMRWCQTYAASHTIPFQSFALSDKNPRYWFNGLYGMGPDEAKDTIMSAQDFEAAYYKALNDMQLGQLITLLYSANIVDPKRYAKPSVYDIGKVLASKDITAATREMMALVISNLEGFSKEDFNTLNNPDKAQVEAAVGLSSRLIGMYQSEVGRTSMMPGNNREVFDVTKTGISYIGLDSLGKPDLTRLVSASVLQRMAVYAAERTSGKEQATQKRFLIVDEANFVNRKLLLNLLSRARSAKIACIVCTQGPSDWASRVQGEPNLNSLVQNTNVSIIMSQGELENAEMCADIIGRVEKMSLTQQVRDGVVGDTGSQRSVVEHIVSPDALRSLTIGEAIVRVGKPNEWQQWVKIMQRDPNF